jgi:hypothetical protein
MLYPAEAIGTIPPVRFHPRPKHSLESGIRAYYSRHSHGFSRSADERRVVETDGSDNPVRAK